MRKIKGSYKQKKHNLSIFTKKEEEMEGGAIIPTARNDTLKYFQSHTFLFKSLTHTHDFFFHT